MTTTQPAKPIHGAPKPKNVPGDMVDTPPVPCAFKVGDRVIGTNDHGVRFHTVVRGFKRVLDMEWAGGKHFIYTETDAWWFPSAEANLSKPDGRPAFLRRHGEGYLWCVLDEQGNIKA